MNDALPELAALGIGGTAVGTGLNAHPRYRELVVKELSRICGVPLFAGAEPLLRHAVAGPLRGALRRRMRVAALELTRIGGDVRLLASGPGHRARRAAPAGGAARVVDHARAR